ncbi:MAG: aminoglycoside phosphotransferase family protein [Thermoflexales bacterium]
MEDLPSGADVWIADRLLARGRRVASRAVCVHHRAWSTVWRIPTTDGAAYFKLCSPALAHEPALTEALSGWRPDCIVDCLGADPARGWLLLDDAGAMLRTQIVAPTDLAVWEPILGTLADLQIELAPRAAEIDALGALDRRPARLAAQVAVLLDNDEALMLDQPDGLTGEDRARLRQLLPHIGALAAELAGTGIPESLHNEDFHDANVYVRDGQVRLSDWGEAGASHPFSTLLVCLRSAAWRLKLPNDGPEIARLRDVYLERWTFRAPRTALLEACTLAGRMGMLCRALTWRQVLAPFGLSASADDRSSVPGWLQEFLNRSSPPKPGTIDSDSPSRV